MEVGQHKGQHIGIGISAKNNQNQLKAAWKLKERMIGSILLDYLQAIKLVLSKVWEQVWECIKVPISSHQILNLLKKPSSKDIRFAANLEDIINLNSMFRKYPFDKQDVEHSRMTKSLSKLARNITFDEECVDPQCISTLLCVSN